MGRMFDYLKKVVAWLFIVYCCFNIVSSEIFSVFKNLSLGEVWRGLSGFNLIPHLIDERQQIYDTHRHDRHGANLSDCIAGKSHEQREHRTTEEPHYHQSADSILLVI